MRAAVLLFPVMLGTGCAHSAASVASDDRAREERTQKIIVQWNRQAPDPASVLRQKALPVQPGDDVPALLAKLRESLAATGGVGIAAPQIGVSRRVFLIKHGTRPVGQAVTVRAYLDPEMVAASEQKLDDYEACLSVADVGGKLPRAKSLRLRYTPEDGGAKQEVELSDWDARIAQHELDHLDGALYIDHVTEPLVPIAEMRRRRDAGHRALGWVK